jgi:hypothetical protein
MLININIMEINVIYVTCIRSSGGTQGECNFSPVNGCHYVLQRLWFFFAMVINSLSINKILWKMLTNVPRALVKETNIIVFVLEVV